jgi:hypothetical protein
MIICQYGSSFPILALSTRNIGRHRLSWIDCEELMRLRQLQLLSNASYRDMRRAEVVMDLPGSLQFYQTSSDLLERIAACEVKVQRLKQEVMPYDNLNSIMSHRISDPSSANERQVSPLETNTRAHTEGMLHTVRAKGAAKDKVTEEKGKRKRGRNRKTPAPEVSVLELENEVIGEAVEPWGSCRAMGGAGSGDVYCTRPTPDMLSYFNIILLEVSQRS